MENSGVVSGLVFADVFFGFNQLDLNVGVSFSQLESSSQTNDSASNDRDIWSNHGGIASESYAGRAEVAAGLISGL